MCMALVMIIGLTFRVDISGAERRMPCYRLPSTGIGLLVQLLPVPYGSFGSDAERRSPLSSFAFQVAGLPMAYRSILPYSRTALVWGQTAR